MSDSTLTEVPPGCGCSACQSDHYNAQMGTSSDTYSSDGIGDINNALSFKYTSTWATDTLQYKFLDNLPSYYVSGDDEAVGFNSFNKQMEEAVLDIFDHIGTFTNLNFTETNNENTNQVLTFGRTNEMGNVKGHAYYPSTHPKGGDVWIDNDGTYNGVYKANDPVAGNYAYMVLMHEIGHALGLEHTFSNYTGSDDTNEFSVMAYNTAGYVEDGSFWTISTFGIYDIAALQSIYGTNTTHASGDDVYTFGFTNWGSIWDTGGTDTIDATTATQDVTINLMPGTLSKIDSPTYYNVGIAYGVTIENANGGSGHDIFIGNDANNILSGNAGDDSFYESGGNDSFYGGLGSDVAIYAGALSEYVVSIVDSVTLTIHTVLNGFIDTIKGIENFLFNNVSYSFADLDSLFGGSYINIVGYDDRKDLIRGGNDAERISGLGGNDDIRGGGGDDLINGGLGDDKISGDAGLDTLHGNLGNDRLLGGDGDDILYGGSGNDHLFGNNDHDTLYGGIGNDYLLGHGGDDVLYGEEGLDYLYGGDGNDTLNGGDGNDILFGNNGNDIMNGEEGDDVLNGHSGNDTLNGGAGNDRLLGSSGDDTLNGDLGNDYINGGTGNDILNGGGGNDRIIGSFGEDTINGGEGNDTVYGGNDNDIISGGLGDDRLYGQRGDDILYGGGGSDRLYGQQGSDIFVFDQNTDINSVVMDFRAVEDRLDLSSVLSSYDAVTDSINDFLLLTQRGGGVEIAVDMDGSANGASFTSVGLVKGINGLDAEDLENGNLLIV